MPAPGAAPAQPKAGEAPKAGGDMKKEAPKAGGDMKKEAPKADVKADPATK
jgi:hypothetical protein